VGHSSTTYIPGALADDNLAITLRAHLSGGFKTLTILDRQFEQPYADRIRGT